MTEPPPLFDAPQGHPIRFPTTHTQQRCWVIDRLKPGNPALNVVARWKICGPAPAASAEAAFRLVIERHEILRTRFVEVDGTPVQEVIPAPRFKLSVFDLSRIDASQHEAKIAEIAAQTSGQPFDLAAARPLRAVLVQLGTDRAVLLVTVHQACFDGWSIGLLAREIGTALAAINAGQTPQLPDLALQFGDYAAWLDQTLTEESLAPERSYWARQLGGLPAFEVPPDLAPPALTDTAPPRSNTVAHSLPPVFGWAMQAACRGQRTTSFAYGVAVLTALLHRMTGQGTVSLGTQVSGRDDPDLEHVIGVFINNLVLRADALGTTDFSAHLAACDAMVKDAMAHRRMPFQQLVALLNPVRLPGRNPLISVNFILQEFPLGDHTHGDVEFINTPSRSPAAVYDLNFVMVGRPGGWRMSLEYDTARYSDTLAEAILRCWHEAYDRVLIRPDARLDTLPGGDLAALARPGPVAARSGQTNPTTVPKPGVSARAIGAVWSDMLGTGPLGPDADFFDHGGHSLLALRMIARLNSELGLTANLAMLFAAPTLGAFAAECAAPPPATPVPTATDPILWSMIAYRDGADACLFTINHPFLYAGLARQMPPGIAVMNLNLFDAPQGAVTGLPFEAIAAEAIRLIEKTGGDRPLGVVGLCVNGRLAAEIARQMRAQSRPLHFTGIIDGWAADALKDISAARLSRLTFRKKLGRARYFMGRLMTGKMTPAAVARQYNFAKALLRALGSRHGIETEEDLKNREVSDVLLQTSLHQGDIATLDAGAHLFASQSSLAMAGPRAFDWKAEPGVVLEVTGIKGWHEDSLERAGIAVIAQNVATALRPGASGPASR